MPQGVIPDTLHTFFRLTGPERAVEIFGIRLVGVSAETAKKLLLTLVLIVVIILLGRLLRAIAYHSFRGRGERIAFWARQLVQLAMAILLILGIG